MPTLKELSLTLGEDSEIQYVTEQSRKQASTEYDVSSENPSSIYTKLNNYPYEFEINGSLQLASIDGIIVSSSNNNDTITISREEYENLKPKSITNESLLLEAINTNKSLGSFDLSTFENTFGSTFENYFSFDNNTGKLACKKSGWYLIDLSLEIDSAADSTSISTLSCFLNNVEISKVKVLGRNFSVLDAGSNSMTIFFNSGDEIDFKKNTTGRAAYYRLYGAVRILKL